MKVTTEHPREVPGEENATERYRRLRAEGSLETDWSACCTAPDYCTRPCSDCGGEARRANEARRTGRW